MLESTVTILQHSIGWFWSFFTSWYLPGTRVTPAAFLLFISVGGIVVRLLKRLIGGSNE